MNCCKYCRSGATTGGSLIGSNYLFQKTIFVDIESKTDAKWDDKLTKLLAKMATETDLAGKIDKSSNASKLAKQENNFQNTTQAKEALQTWCENKNKTEAKEHEKDLYKIEKQVGWLLG